MMQPRRRPIIGALSLALVANVWVPPAASAALQCGRREPIVAGLARLYGERLVATALSHTGLAVEVFVSDGGTTFTILRSWPSGVTCILDHGENWRFEDAHPKREEEGA